jgi:polyhydroxybutyrate depolymerase
MINVHFFLLIATLGTDPLGPGDHTRTLTVDGRERSYLVHVPPKYDPKKPTPVILLFHGAGSDGAMHVQFTGMNEKSDAAGFIAVYPNGTGLGRLLLWNVDGRHGQADDVKFVSALLDDLATVVNVDARRVYASGCSMGGMMCYRLAADLSDRIAAIAPVAGTMVGEANKPNRPVPVLHFHGTADKIVPFKGSRQGTSKFLAFKSVEETIRIWCQIDGCPNTPKVTEFPDKVDDGTTVKRKVYGPGQDGAEVVLIEIEGGGHTWPGRKPPVGFIGKSTLDISANDLIWEFFQKHPRTAATRPGP